MDQGEDLLRSADGFHATPAIYLKTPKDIFAYGEFTVSRELHLFIERMDCCFSLGLYLHSREYHLHRHKVNLSVSFCDYFLALLLVGKKEVTKRGPETVTFLLLVWVSSTSHKTDPISLSLVFRQNERPNSATSIRAEVNDAT